MPEITDEELADLRAKAAQVDALQGKVAEADATAAALAQAQADAHTATEAARAAIITANPTIPADLIKGDTIQQIQESLATAQTIALRLAEAAAATPKTPLGFTLGGGNIRQQADTAGLSPMQKVLYGLQHERGQHTA